MNRHLGLVFIAVLARSQEKLDIILNRFILAKGSTHAAAVVNALSNPHGSRRRIVGVYIPCVCTGLLIVGFVLAALGVLHVPP